MDGYGGFGLGVVELWKCWVLIGGFVWSILL